MKKIVGELLIFIAIALFFIAVFMFILWEYDISKWHLLARAANMFFTIWLYALFAIIRHKDF